MDNTVQAAPAKTQYRHIGLVSMGITLIGAGVVMLMVQFGWMRLPGFTWLLPAYLIVLGAETLAVRLLMNRREPQVRLIPSVGSVAITLGVLFFVRLWGLLVNTGIHSWMYW